MEEKKIWDEKPFSLEDLRVDDKGNPVKSEMDTWLEKVKEKLDILTVRAERYHEILLERESELEEIETWLKDAPEPLFLEPGRSPFISETSMEVWMEKCPLKAQSPEYGP